MAYRLGVDVGGTFTDLLLIDEASGETYRAKVPSTPEDSSIAVLGGIEQVHRPGKIKVAVCIEAADELSGVGFQVGFHFEIDAEWITGLPFFRYSLPTESLVELLCGSIGHHAQLSGKTHADDGTFC